MAVFSTIGNIIGADKQADAAENAADTSLKVAKENNKLQREIYGQNKAMLTPFVQRGNAAGDTLNALLGLGGSQYTQQSSSPEQNAWVDSIVSKFGGGHQNRYYSAVKSDLTPDEKIQVLIGQASNPSAARAAIETLKSQTPMPSVADDNGQSAQQAADSAFDTFRNSTNYQWRFAEGQNALESNLAGAGVGQSGAALKAISDYGQNTASNELGSYMGLLGNQQGVGLSGASASSGVGQNFANSVSANNNAAGTAQANALLAGGAASAAPWYGIGNSLGSAAGIFAAGGF